MVDGEIKNKTGISTGFKSIDNITKGLHPGELVIVAARPGMGKTSFCLNIARNAAVHYKVPVLYFSLDMSKGLLGLRMLCSEALVDQHRLRTGLLQEEALVKIETAMGTLSSSPIYVDDSLLLTVLEMQAKACELKAGRGLGLIIIDYLQLITIIDQHKNRAKEMSESEIARELKNMAKELHIPVIAACYLNREIEDRQNKRPRISDFIKSKGIVEEADIIFFIYRDSYYNEHTNEKNVAEIIIAKNTNGIRGTIELIFQREYARFAEKNYSKPTSLKLLGT